MAKPQPKKKQITIFSNSKILSDSLSKWLDENENLQKDVKKYVQNWIKSGLIDWDITRDISWGVPVPLDDAAKAKSSMDGLIIIWHTFQLQ